MSSYDTSLSWIPWKSSNTSLCGDCTMLGCFDFVFCTTVSSCLLQMLSDMVSWDAFFISALSEKSLLEKSTEVLLIFGLLDSFAVSTSLLLYSGDVTIFLRSLDFLSLPSSKYKSEIKYKMAVTHCDLNIQEFPSNVILEFDNINIKLLCYIVTLLYL